MTSDRDTALRFNRGAPLTRIARDKYATDRGDYEAQVLDDGRVRVWRTPCQHGPRLRELGTFRFLSEAAAAIAAEQARERKEAT